MQNFNLKSGPQKALHVICVYMCLSISYTICGV